MQSLAPEPKEPVSSFDDQFYGPQFLLEWSNFAEDHATTFAKLLQTLGDEAIFPSFVDVQLKRQSCYNSSSHRNGSYKFSLPIFIQDSMETLAEALVQFYLQQMHKERQPGPGVETSVTGLRIQNEAFGLEPQDRGDVDVDW
jgi:hypothetical protein